MFTYVSTKREYLAKYLKSMKEIKGESITFNGEVIGSKTYYEDKGTIIEVEKYFNLNNLCIIRTGDATYIPPKGFVKVNDIFSKESIVNGNIQVTNFILEGTDGIGKSTSIEKLLNEGIACLDRNLDVICKYMLFDVPMEKRIEEYKKYLESTKDRILFLVNMDAEELRRRIYSRDVVTEFDKYAVEYNQMYYDTYNEMACLGYLYDKLFLLDCTNLTEEEQKEKIKEIILRWFYAKHCCSLCMWKISC